MKQILETLYALGLENPWVAALSVAAVIITAVVVCALVCAILAQVRDARTIKELRRLLNPSPTATAGKEGE